MAMKDWKTTVAGVLTIIGTLTNAGLGLLHSQPLNLPVVIAGITTGVGLIHAADSK
jgi:hypothetical protein